MPFVDPRAPLPPQVTRKPVRGQQGRAGQPITPRTVNLTPNTATVFDKNPFWSKDEQFIAFQSNRADLQGRQAGTLEHIYTMRPDGSGVTPITGPLASPPVGASTHQTEPAFNSGGSSIVYVERDPNAGTVDLVEINLATRTTRRLVANNPNGLTFADLNHPEYGFALGGNVGIIFAGRLTGRNDFDLFTVDTQSGRITALTSTPDDDRNPTLSPDPQRPVIAFDRAPAGNLNGPRDIYVIGINPSIQNAKRVTNFSAGGRPSDNREPAWSTNKVDNPSGDPRTQFVRGQQLLAFASTRFDTAGDGNANAVRTDGNHDIYWLRTTIGIDPDNPSVYTVLTPEDTNNAASKLPTSDPTGIYDDRRPTWPQFISTYRVAYQTNRTAFDPANDSSVPANPNASTPTDIFASTLIDLNAPTLIRFDEVTGDILSVVPRNAIPGSNVTVKVKLADFEAGIRDVYLQVKNPNSKYQSSDRREHKVYLNLFASPDHTNLAPFPIEYESQRIFIGSDPNDPRVNSYADPRYIASVDDFYAFSGSTRAPDPGWLPMTLESRDPVTGVSTYTATFKTDNFASDYYLDVIAYDNALNPFSTSSQDRGNNWKIYDNIWGFTTQTFSARNNILFVSDYAAGQKFFNTRFDNFALVNTFYTFWGTESYMTEIDTALLAPRTYVPRSGGTGGTLYNFLNTLGVKSTGAFAANDFWTSGQEDSRLLDGTREDGADVPAPQQYDIWRVLCRGPVPDIVLQQYAPRFETQPADPLTGVPERSVMVAQKAVIWHAPYTGGVFAGPGTLTDIQVQNQLTSFVASGGRLLVNGQDIGWALTLDGTAQNAFFTNVLRANYVRDQPGGFTIVQAGGGIPLARFFSGAYAMTAAGAPNPITHDPWITGSIVQIEPHHLYFGPPDPPLYKDFVSTEALHLVSGTDPQNNQRTWGSPGVVYPDVVAPRTGVTAAVNYGGGAGAALLHYIDAATGQRVIYVSSGMEGFSSSAFTPPNTQNTLVLRNRRSQIMMNAMAWLRTGTVFGTVRDVEAGNPLPGVLVRLSRRVNSQGRVIPDYTAVTRDDGSFVMNGVETDQYDISAFLPGFVIQKPTGVQVHGGWRTDMSFRMTRAQPAVIRGKVTRTDGVTPVVGATVVATDNNVVSGGTPATFSAVTDADGRYVISRVPAQTTYTLTCSATGFGASIPANYPVPNPQDPIPGQRDQVVQPAKTYDGFDFQLAPEPGAATGLVLRDSDGSPIANATVTATRGNQTVTATTGADGRYRFDRTNNPPNGLDPGIWGLVATAPGFAPNSPPVQVTVVSGETVNAPDIRLTTVPPGSLSGLVTRSSDNAPLTGVLIQVRDPNGNVLASTTTGPVQNVGGYQFNYVIANVPAGVTYTVSATRSGFTANPLTRTAAVNSGQETRNVNFSMEALQTFSGSMTMVSAPYDYPTFDIGDLLSVPPADRGKSFIFATWFLGRYALYSQAPAKTFRLGTGYFMAYRTNLPLSTEGTPADPNQPFNIPLNAGWNMIGNPFLFDIDWTKVKVVYNGQTLSQQQAVAQGLIAPALWGYVSGSYVLDFRLVTWRGYWVRAYQNVTLRIDPRTDAIGRAAPAPAVSRAVLQGGDGWSLNLRANVGSVQDNDNYLGMSSRATDGFDGYKVEKPPVFGDRYVHLTFDHTSWGDRSGGYGVDIRSSSTAPRTWEFSVQTNVPNSTATLTWPNAAAISKGHTLTLTDLVTGQSRDLRTTSSYSWQTGDQPATRRFKIEVAPADRNVLRITGVVGRTAPGRSSGVNVSYHLSAAANVEVRILGANGQTLRQVTGRSSRSAGIQQVTWDQKTDQGVAVPSGSYLVEIRAETPDGKQRVRTVTPIVVTR